MAAAGFPSADVCHHACRPMQLLFFLTACDHGIVVQERVFKYSRAFEELIAPNY